MTHGIAQEDGLEAPDHDQEDLLVLPRVEAAGRDLGRAAVEIVHDPIADLLRLRGHDCEVLDAVETLDEVVDNHPLEEEARQGEKTRLEVEDKEG